MRLFDKLTIKYKLITIILTVTILALISGSIFVLLDEVSTFKKDMVDKIILGADITSDFLVTDLAFGDVVEAGKTLEKLNSLPEVTYACVYDQNQQFVVAIGAPANEYAQPLLQRNKHLFDSGLLHVLHPIEYQGSTYGTLYIQASTDRLERKIINYAGTMVVFLLVLIGLSVFTAIKLQVVISRPILALAETTQDVSKENDYSIRVERRNNDEIGVLYDGFNRMLEQIEQRDRKLRENEEKLQNAIRIAKLGYWEWDIPADKVSWSGQIYDIYDVDRDQEITYDVVMSRIHPDDREYHNRKTEEWIKNKRGTPYEYRVQRQDGSVRYVRAEGEVLTNEQSEAIKFTGTVQDITEEKEATLALEQSEEKYRSLFDDSPVPLWEEEFSELLGFLEELKAKGIDDFRTYFDEHPEELQICAQKVDIRDVNRATLQLHGAQNKEELLGKLEKIFTANSFDVFKEEVICLAEGKVQFESEAEVKTLQGEPRYIFLRLKLDTTQSGNYRALLATADITDRKLAEEELRKYQQKLEQLVEERTTELRVANKELEAFAYSVSHDLRGPLRAIDGYSQILKEDYRDRLDAEGVRFLDSVQNGVHKMSDLIDALLDLSRITRQELHIQPVNLSEMAHTIGKELQNREPKRKVRMEIAENCITWGDPKLLERVLTNLLENAWKYSATKKQPKIKFSCKSVKGEQVFFVKDNGVGFNMDYAGKLFGAFQRLHQQSEFPGIGIGLATVKRIIQRHGGRIWAEAREGRGASFYFTIKSKRSAVDE